MSSNRISAYAKNIFPTPAWCIAFLGLPIFLTIYFVATQYSDRFILEQNISYYDVQNNWLGQLYISQEWLSLFNRFMDFAFWGVLAAAILVGVWAVSSAKVTFRNHYAQEDFKNFKGTKQSWHTHFYVVVFLKTLLVIIALYALLILATKLVPQLSIAAGTVAGGITAESVVPLLCSALAIVLCQFIFATAIKVFRHLRTE